LVRRLKPPLGACGAPSRKTLERQRHSWRVAAGRKAEATIPARCDGSGIEFGRCVTDGEPPIPTAVTLVASHRYPPCDLPDGRLTPD
jgi:hypothetical protein